MICIVVHLKNTKKDLIHSEIIEVLTRLSNCPNTVELLSLLKKTCHQKSRTLRLARKSKYCKKDTNSLIDIIALLELPCLNCTNDRAQAQFNKTPRASV